MTFRTTLHASISMLMLAFAVSMAHAVDPVDPANNESGGLVVDPAEFVIDEKAATKGFTIPEPAAGLLALLGFAWLLRRRG